MTIVNHTSAAHSGMLVTGTGDDLEIDLEIVGGRTLRMSSSGDELGAWPVDECHIEPDPTKSGSFRLVVDGEDARFTPSDAVGFQALVDRLTGESVDEAPPVSPQIEESAASVVSAAEDPVAFLFGSSRPPTPVTTELPDFDSVEADQGWSEASNEAVEPDTVVDEVDQFEDVETVTAGAAWGSSTQVESPTETEVAPADLDDDDHAELEEPEFPPLPEDSPVDGIDLDDTPDAGDAAEDLRSRVVGGSALERLSAAIGSIRGSADDAGADEDDPDDEYSVGPNTVASDVLETQRSLREHQLKEMAKSKWLKWAGVVVATASVIALFAFLTPRAIDFLQSYESDIAPPPEMTETTVPPTTAATAGEDGAPEDTTPDALPIGTENGTIFDRPSPEFIAAWDATGGAIDEVLTFDGFPQLGPFEERFTPYLQLNGIVQPDGTLDQFSLVIDPTGPAEYDRIGIQALGVAIATVDPDRSPQGRASLLGELGLNVRQPLLEGVDGVAEAAGIAYTLVYDAAANLLTLTVSPAS